MTMGLDGGRYAVGHLLLGLTRLEAFDHGGHRATGRKRGAGSQGLGAPLVGNSSSFDHTIWPMRWNLGIVSVPRLLALDSSSASSTASRLAS
jgi:hypothetical protein